MEHTFDIKRQHAHADADVMIILAVLLGLLFIGALGAFGRRRRFRRRLVMAGPVVRRRMVRRRLARRF